MLPPNEDRSCGSISTLRPHQIDIQAHINPKLDNVLFGWIFCLKLTLTLVMVLFLGNVELSNENAKVQPNKSRILLASAHIVLTRDDRGQSLVLTGEDGKGGGKGKGGGGDQLVIAGNNMGDQNSNMVLEDAANREGDVVINGNSMVIPGEDGHIVLADSRDRQGGGGGDDRNRPPPMQNMFAFWMPFMNSRMVYRMMPFFGGQFG